MRILVADDEQDTVEMIRACLQRDGHAVDLAFDGEQALEKMKKQEYDLVFIDHNMPVLTGLEVIKRMKETGNKAKAVMITGYPEMESFLARAVGADEYIEKPIQMEVIRNTVTRFSGHTE